MLTDYLATEQAREDVRELLNGDKRAVCINEIDDSGWVKDEAWAWTSLWLWDDAQRREVVAYYRPDGDRFVVTDLGEGVRALRLRTGAQYLNLLQMCRRSKDAEHFYGKLGKIYDATLGAGNWERGSALGTLLDVTTEARAADLPDALCRVMLASLKVSEVQP